MEFTASRADVAAQQSACAVLPVFEEGKLSRALSPLDREARESVEKLYQRGDLKGEAGDSLLLYGLPGCPAERVLLLGFGKQRGCGPEDYRKTLDSAAKLLHDSGADNTHLFLEDVHVEGRDEAWKARQAVQLLEYRGYRFQQCKSEKRPHSKLESATYAVSRDDQVAGLQKATTDAAATARGVSYSRELGNLPGNICTPRYLADEARTLAEDGTISATVLGEEQMRELNMGSLLSVTAGSAEEAQLIAMEYRGGAKSDKPTVLVGKGITFDTGGISIKPGPGMDEMKFDMCGAASVFGVMKALQVLKPKLNVVGLVAAAENMPSGRATKPGDIVTSMAGKTIEVLNTDAEGRLVLCDALTYAERYKPRAVIDVATLTGACVIALGNHASGLYSNRDELAEQLLAAGDDSGDRAWRMPLWDEYRKQLDSNFADLANIGGREAGSITAACFLAHFTENYPWAHLDIAGTGWRSNADKGATGRPVSLLMRYLLQSA